MRRQERLDAVAQRVEFVKAHFPELVADYDAKSPFRRTGQLEAHLRTIAARRSAGSVRAALAGDSFSSLLYITLQKWGIGKRRSNLVNAAPFAASLRRCGPQIEALERLAIDDPGIDVAGIASDIMQVIENLKIVRNKALLVPCTKALHHLLPELVVPIDRKFTQRFFGWSQLQSHHREHFCEAFAAFADIARSANPQQYVGTQKWHSSRTKVIDNAIVSFVDALRREGTGAPIPSLGHRRAAFGNEAPPPVPKALRTRQEGTMTCRDEVLAAAKAVVSKARRNAFTIEDVVTEMQRRRSRYSDRTIRTHVSSRMCIDAPAHHAVRYGDFVRLERGWYALSE